MRTRVGNSRRSEFNKRKTLRFAHSKASGEDGEAIVGSKGGNFIVEALVVFLQRLARKLCLGHRIGQTGKV